MTNYEKYRDEIMRSTEDVYAVCDKFVIPNILKPMNRGCGDISCKLCNKLFSMWLMDEYKEPEVDWSKVPVDTKIYVKPCENTDWRPRHFAKYEKGEVYAWNDGATSWTTGGMYHWAYAKLAEVE